MKLKGVTDLDLIIFLISKGFEVIDTQRSGNKTIFYFNDTTELNKSFKSFVNKTETANVADILSAKRRVKTLLTIQNK